MEAREDNRNLKETLLMAAIEEFGAKGYHGSSTNEIVKNAGASKGLLFHYYKNKSNLYLESLFYVMSSLGEYMAERIDFSDRDMFERIKNSTQIKLDFCRRHPSFLALMERVWYHDEDKEVPGLKEFFEVSVDKFRSKIIWDKFYDGLDTGKLRKGLDVRRVMDYTTLATEALWLRFSKKHGCNAENIAEDMDAFIAEMEELINLIKYGVYE